MTHERAKKAAGEAAADLIRNGMRVGLGTGSTASAFIIALARRCSEGLDIECVSSSVPSFILAQSLDIPLIDINSIDRLDVTVDGADEIDAQKVMIKGGGGALLREKILAAMSEEMIVVIDESKLVESIGKFPLPVEIIPFALPATIRHLTEAGYRGELRRNANGKPFITENENLIYDLQIGTPIKEYNALQERLLRIPGIVDTGLFIGYAGRVIIGHLDGTVEIRP